MQGESDWDKVYRFVHILRRLLLNKPVIITVLFILIALNVFYIFFFYSKPCADFECFKSSMEDCNRANYINEEAEATWGYNILGSADDSSCLVNVKLLQAKEGESGISELAGYDMNCDVLKGIGTYPDKDLSRCHGRLKEELQGLVINKLHINILENLQEIKKSLGGVL